MADNQGKFKRPFHTKSHRLSFLDFPDLLSRDQFNSYSGGTDASTTSPYSDLTKANLIKAEDEAEQYTFKLSQTESSTELSKLEFTQDHFGNCAIFDDQVQEANFLANFSTKFHEKICELSRFRDQIKTFH
jgi:hypothetical protein